MTLWMQLINGKPYDYVGNAKLDISPADLARALSHINRFGGHTRKPYSVAQHCVVVSRYLDFCPLYAMHGLLHDAHEGLVMDVLTPMKWALGLEPLPGSKAPATNGKQWRVIEDRAELQVYSMAGVIPPSDAQRAAVKQADTVALLTEKRDLLEPGERKWSDFPAVAHHRRITPWSHRRARVEWEARFAGLLSVLQSGPEYRHAIVGKG